MCARTRARAHAYMCMCGVCGCRCGNALYIFHYHSLFPPLLSPKLIIMISYLSLDSLPSKILLPNVKASLTTRHGSIFQGLFLSIYDLISMICVFY